MSGHPVFATHVSVWEATIKASLGTLGVPPNFDRAVEDSGLTPLPIDIPHIEALNNLPQHHRDPFDRGLVAQARVRGMRLATRGGEIPRYDIDVLSV